MKIEFTASVDIMPLSLQINISKCKHYERVNITLGDSQKHLSELEEN